MPDFSAFSDDEKRRLEEKIRRLEEELEEEMNSVELVQDTMRKAQMQVWISNYAVVPMFE